MIVYRRIKTAVVSCLMSWALLGVCARLSAQTAGAPNPPSRAPFGWLRVPEKAIILQITQSGLSDANRQYASQLVFYDVLDPIVQSGYQVFLTTAFVAAEGAFYRRRNSNGLQGEIDRALASCLEDFVKNGAIDWARLKQMTSEYGDQFTLGGERLPWSVKSDEIQVPRLVKMPAAAPQNIPVLELTVAWSGRSGHQGAIPLGGDGLTVSNLAVSFRLKDGAGRELFRRSYTKGAEKSAYKDWADTPAEQIIDRIRDDFLRGIIVEKSIPRKPSRSNVPSIAGSRWRVRPDGQPEYEMEFKPGGQFVYYERGETNIGDQWVQNGEIIRFSVTDHYVEYEAELTDRGILSGVAKASHGTWRWTASRVQR
jgi:hypothetical protein